jgi:8-oxo-dGTP pyrophosphatase MutT (NUDIX family)
VVFRRGPGGVELMVGEQRDRITGARTLRLPKGKRDRHESLEQAALRELREETGVDAKVVAPLGCVEYTYRDAGAEVAKTVHFFLMQGKPGRAATPDGEFERSVWLSPERARAELTYATERQVVERAIEQLARLA